MTAAPPTRGAFRVAERVYGDTDQFGFRPLLHAAGAVIPWERAVELGLVADGEVPDAQALVQTPVALYEEDPATGDRTLAHRAGSMVPLDEFERLRPRTPEEGVSAAAAPEASAEAPEGAQGADGGEEPPRAEPEREERKGPQQRRPGSGQPTRTTKRQAPDE